MPRAKTPTASEESPRAPRLPRPERLVMRRFSLFDHTTSPDLVFPDGVYCLAGANGLGKSTFLAALAYAVTGVVAEPGRGFPSAEDYYKKVAPYHKTYFRGRIGGDDIEAAEVELEMCLGEYRYRLVRGIFESGELRELEVSSLADDGVLEDAEQLDPAARHDRYVELAVKHSGLDSFAQLVFLQHYVMLFDERRELLFWNETALSNALYLAFGLDPGMASRADSLQEEIRKQDSLSRNYGWQASDVRRQLDGLANAAAKLADEPGEDDDLIDRQHRVLSEKHTELVALSERLASQVTDAQLEISARSNDLRALRNEYDTLWSQRLQGHGHPGSHPVVTATLQDRRCSLCGTTGDVVVAHVSRALADEHCPLCASPLAGGQGEGEGPSVRLQELDAEIVQQQEAMANAERALSRLDNEHKAVLADIAAARAELTSFARSNEAVLLRRDSNPEGIDALRSVYESQIAERLDRQKAARAKRDRAKAAVRPLQKELMERYTEAQEHFVPRFEKLAQEFLGLELDVEFTTKANKASLRLSVAGQRRREDVTLSESQRFFVDIALRMALLQHIGDRQAIRPALLIDTPEGSLDIAYEAKAGSMFSLFARDGYRLIMTANINTSELLLRLAKECGTKRMKLERMTEWAALSEVQEEEEDLFNNAYKRIVTELRSGG